MDTRSAKRVWAARVLAMVADLTQICLAPVFIEGALSPLGAALDVAVAVAMIGMLGWHWAFLPSVLAEAVPGLDLFPTWTAAVLFVTADAGLSGTGTPQLPAAPQDQAQSAD